MFFILISIKIEVFFTILFKKYLKKSMQDYTTSKDCVKKVPFKALLSVAGAPTSIGEKTVRRLWGQWGMRNNAYTVIDRLLLNQAHNYQNYHYNSLELKKGSINQKNPIDQL